MFYSFLLFVVSNELLVHVARINIREKEDGRALEELDHRFLIAAAVIVNDLLASTKSLKVRKPSVLYFLASSFLVVA